MGTYVRYPCAHTTKKPLPTVGGFLERLVKRDANPVPVAFTGQEKYTRFSGAVKRAVPSRKVASTTKQLK